MKRMVCWLAEQNVVSVAMESTSVYWIPVCDLLESGVFEVVLVDTREVRMEARKPTPIGSSLVTAALALS